MLATCVMYGVLTTLSYLPDTLRKPEWFDPKAKPQYRIRIVFEGRRLPEESLVYYTLRPAQPAAS